MGNLKVVFNNAGISHADDDGAVTTTEDVWDLTMKVNVKGVFLGCKYAIPALLRNGGGSIINTGLLRHAVVGPAMSAVAYCLLMPTYHHHHHYHYHHVVVVFVNCSFVRCHSRGCYSASMY
jgi:NAD(P)-dependent dehydrogenase (short-subunit alcohol dehydrogenase family)